MAKGRGRKRTNDLYFGPVEEEAVSKFISLGKMVYHPNCPVKEHNSVEDCIKDKCDKNPMMWVGTEEEAIERNRIYNTFLKEPLNKMIESIIRRYKLYRKSVSFEELHMDTLSFLMTKVHKFENSQGTKAYSYYGTICKNFILGLLIKDDKKMKQMSSYEDIYLNLEEDQKFSYTIDDSPKENLSNFIKTISDEIKFELVEDEKTEGKLMNENERKLGFALIDILDNWEEIFNNLEGGKKYNKISMLASIRENTNLTTKDIRAAMKRYKKMYLLLKDKQIESGLL
jgi:hypothetical protein